MATINQIYVRAGSLMKLDKSNTYRMVRRNIEKLVFQGKYKWYEEATKEFMDEVFKKDLKMGRSEPK